LWAIEHSLKPSTSIKWPFINLEGYMCKVWPF
jgi:hypothetical protein